MSVRDLIIVGAGPSGLSAAIAAKQRGLDYQVLEQGVLVNSIYRFPAADGVLHDAGAARDRRPAVRVAVREADARRGAAATTARSWTRSICRSRSRRRCCRSTRRGRRAREQTAGVRRRDAVVARRAPRPARAARVLAIGYYDQPNLLGMPGEDLPHVHHYYSEPHPYYRQRVVIVGGGNSAAEAALELYRAGAHVTLVHRHAGAEVDDQVLGAAGHREPDQGRVDRGAVQHAA